MLKVKRVGIAMALAVLAASELSAQPARRVPVEADLQGAWRLVLREVGGKKEEAKGLMFFAGNRLGFITTGVRPDLPSELNTKPVAELTDAEKVLFVEAYRSMTSAAGTYTIENGEIRFTVEVSRQPRLPTKPEDRKSWIEGERLVQDFVNSRGVHSLYVWERAK
jgi:hypothetical protein